MKNISFCNRVCQNIVDSDLKQTILNDITSRFDANIVRRHHARMDAKALARVSKAPHIVCLRSNGNPYFMFLTRHHHKNVCIFIDKKIQGGYALPRMVLAPFQLAPSLFAGTLLEGEMVKDTNNKWLFLINDAWGYCGKTLADATVSERLQHVDAMLRTQFAPCMHDICVFQLKRYVKVTELQQLTDEFSPTLPYTSRGLLFKPLYRKFCDVLYNFDDSLIIKAQPSQQNKEVVVESVGQPQTMRVVRGVDTDVYKFVEGGGTLRVKTLSDSLKLRASFLNQPITKQIDVLCAMDRGKQTFMGFDLRKIKTDGE